jgi:large subunit ribosomal protein L29
MKQKEIISLSVPELNSKLNELRKNLMKENAQIAIGTTPKSPGIVRSMKKTIAKIMFTIHNKSKLQANAQDAKTAVKPTIKSTKSVSKEEIPKKQKQPVSKTVED